MGRKKLPGFRDQKMLSSRVELQDYIKLEEALYPQYGKRIKIQDILNVFVRSCISGSIKLTADKELFVGGDDDSVDENP